MQHVNRAVAVSANVVDCRLVLLIDGLQSLKMLATEKKLLRNVSQYYCKYNSICIGLESRVSEDYCIVYNIILAYLSRAVQFGRFHFFANAVAEKVESDDVHAVSN